MYPAKEPNKLPNDPQKSHIYIPPQKSRTHYRGLLLIHQWATYITQKSPTKYVSIRKRAVYIPHQKETNTVTRLTINLQKSHRYPTREPNKLPVNPQKTHIHPAAKEADTVLRLAIYLRKSHTYPAKEPNISSKKIPQGIEARYRWSKRGDNVGNQT